MQILRNLTHFNFDLQLISVVIFFVFFGLILMLFDRKSKQKAVLAVEKSLKLQEHTNQQLLAIINELKRANRSLCELSGEPLESMSQSNAYSHNGHNHNGHNSSYPTKNGYQASNDAYDPYSYPNHDHGASNSSENGSHHASHDFLSATKLYVGNIDYAATENELANHFSRCGKIEFVNIPVNRYTGRTRGFGFITFASKDDAERAMTMHGSEFRGRQIQVNFAKERD